MTYKKPLPQPNADTEPFWDGCCEHVLRFQKCKGCGHIRWPASFLCPACHSRETAWIAAEGRGKIYSYVVYHRAYHPGFEGEVPYVVALVELEEGPRMITNIIGCRPEEVRCGMPVEVAWEDIEGGISLPKFRIL
ncbi:MAG: Zn-ribbon domain-containing OB-fold protein [Pseudomonadota bacterium]